MGEMVELTTRRTLGNEFLPFDCDVRYTLIEDGDFPVY